MLPAEEESQNVQPQVSLRDTQYPGTLCVCPEQGYRDDIFLQKHPSVLFLLEIYL